MKNEMSVCFCPDTSRYIWFPVFLPQRIGYFPFAVVHILSKWQLPNTGGCISKSKKSIKKGNKNIFNERSFVNIFRALNWRNYNFN